jgi:hypothetical protein
MGKPIVRFVVDKDILPKLIPEGDIEAQLSLDNAVVQLIQEAGRRLFTESFIEAFEKRFEHAVQGELHTGWGHSSEPIDKLVGEAVKKAVAHYATEKVQEVIDKTVAILETTVKSRLNVAQKLVDQYTTPEGIEALMVKACAALVKGEIK